MSAARFSANGWKSALALAATLGLAAAGHGQPCTPQWDWPSNQDPGVQSLVRAAATWNDGSGVIKLYVGGSLISAGGQLVDYIAVWDGLSWSPLAGGTDGPVHALLAHDDGSGPALYVAGAFSQVFTAGGTPIAANNIARWDGTNWSSIGSGASNGVNGAVLALTPYFDGIGNMLVAGGGFTTAGGAAALRVAAWNGNNWMSYGSGLGVAGSSTPKVFALAVYSNPLGQTHLYAGGNFDVSGAAPIGKIARWTGAAWQTAGTPVTGNVYALHVHDDGSGLKLFAGGTFTQLQGAGGPFTVNRLASYNGLSWSAVGTGLSGEVTALLGLPLVSLPGSPTSKLYVGGFFASAGGQPASNLAMWDGTNWSAAGAGTSGPVSALANGFSAYSVVSGVDVFVGGTFADAGGRTVNNIVHYDGTDYTPMFGQFFGTNGEVRAVTGFKDGATESLYAAGDFTIAGSASLAFGHIARWDGTSWADVDGGVNGPANALAVHDDGGGEALYVGGDFGFAGFASSIATGPVARWDGFSWSALAGSLAGQVECLVSVDEPGGPRLYASGVLTVGGVPGYVLAAWDGFSWTPIVGGAITISSLQLQQVHAMTRRMEFGQESLVVAGQFTSLSLVQAGVRVARWTGSSWSPYGGKFTGIPSAVHSWDSTGAGGLGEQLIVAGSLTAVDATPLQGLAEFTGALGSGWVALGSVTNGTIHAMSDFDDGVTWNQPFAGGSFTALGNPANRIARMSGSWVASGLGSGVDSPANAEVLALGTWNRPSGVTLVIGGRFHSVNGQSVSNIATWRGCAVAASPCPGDVNGDGQVSGLDLALLLAAWTPPLGTYFPCPPYHPADLNQDCKINGTDLALLLAAWGPCP